MATIFDAEFVDISVPVLKRITGKLPFDVYIRRASDTYNKLFVRDDKIDLKRLKNYESEKGVRELFVKKEDYRQYLFYVERVANNFFENPEKISADDLVQVVKEMADLSMLELVVNFQVDHQSLVHATKTIHGCLEVLSKDPKALVKILKLMSKHPYTMKHSIASSLFALLLAQLDGLESDKTLTTVGLGALLHDIGMSQLPFDAEEKTELTGEEWREVKEHPHLGNRMLDTIKIIPREVLSIVLQHHEQPNGLGYPNGLRDKDIYHLAKIVSIADAFTALVSKRPYREDVCSPMKALELMVGERGKYDVELLEQFSTLFVQVTHQPQSA